MTVCVAAFALGMVGWVVTAQISGLLRELPKYSENIKAKAKSLKQVAASSNRLTRMFVDINQELGSGPSAGNAKGAESEDRPERAQIGPIGSSSSRKARSGCRGSRHFWLP